MVIMAHGLAFLRGSWWGQAGGVRRRVRVCDMLDSLAVNLDGTRAAPSYFSRRRTVLYRVLGHAVRNKRLDVNLVTKNKWKRSAAFWRKPISRLHLQIEIAVYLATVPTSAIVTSRAASSTA